MTSDGWIVIEIGGLLISATIFFTWIVMALLIVGCWLVTSRLSDDERITPWQNALETLVLGVRDQISAIGVARPEAFLPLIGTLFLFIAASNLLSVVPGFAPPTGSLSTTTALALIVLVAAPGYGIARRGLTDYLKGYLQPTVLMAPFNVIGEISRTIALAVRLFGNVMSGTVIAGVLISIAPFFFPVIMQLLGLITGLIQAYIFAVLAMVYIASATGVGQSSKGQDHG